MNLRERLQRKGDYIWELPAGTVEGQRVPVILYLSPALFELLEEEAIRQAANAATLRGVRRAVYVMPDVHVGYGFPVGGVMATDAETGIISPGSVGYDINCLPEGTRILSELGYSFRIEEFRGERLTGISAGRGKPVTPVLLFKRRESVLLELETSLGYSLRLSPDHPVLTPRGMVEAGQLREGDRVALYPFRGIPYEEPPAITLLEGRWVSGSGEVYPLRTDAPSFPYLLRDLGGALAGSGEREQLLHLAEDLGLSQGYPDWLRRLPLWMKRLYLGGVFGANEDLAVVSDSVGFLEGIRALLEEFGVVSEIRGGAVVVDTSVDNLFRLCAVLFPDLKLSLRSELLRTLFGRSALSLAVGEEGFTAEAVFQDILWDEITAVREERYGGWVYDFTVAEREHNFVAEGFVVSNCGVRLIATDLRREDVEPRIRELMEEILRKVPSGVGSRGEIRLSRSSMEELLVRGARWAVEHGYGFEEDLAHIESGGALPGADPSRASPSAYERGSDELGTVGSGNHFVEVQVVEEVYDPATADILGLEKGQVTLMVHSGSRGFGHQVCTDYLKVAVQALSKYGIELPDPQLACMPFSSEEGQDYFRAMCAAANYAFANRQILGFLTAQAVRRFLGISWEELGYRLIYDHAHNIAKVEEHSVGGVSRRLVVHRKGATRAFPPRNPEVPPAYRDTGQPVIIPGDMGRASFLLVGQPAAMELSFGTACHGAGRVMSRRQAKKLVKERGLESVIGDLVVVARGKGTIMEEIPEAYKDVTEVVRVIHELGIAKVVVRLKPLGTLKG